MFTQPLQDTTLDSIFDHLREGILYYTPLVADRAADGDPVDFFISYCNKEAGLCIKVDKPDLQGRTALTFPNIDEVLRAVMFAQLRQVYGTGKPLESTLFNAVLDRHFRTRMTKVGSGVLTEFTDITPEVLEQQVNEHRHELSKLVLDSSLNAWFSCDAVRNKEGHIVDFVITQINAAFTRLLGLTAENVVGKSYLGLFPPTKYDGTFELNCRVIETGVRERRQMPYQFQGENRWYDVVVSSLQTDGFLVSFQDITAYVKAIEEIKTQKTLLDNILTHSATGISVTEVIRDRTGNIVDGKTFLANDAAYKYAAEYLGLSKQDYLSKTVRDLDPGILESPLYQLSLKTLSTGEPFRFEYFLEPANRWLELSVSKMDDDHLINIFTDITENKQTQIRQENLLEELQRSNENLEDFTRAASHDLKEPIRKVHTFADLLKDRLVGRLDDYEQNIFNRMILATERMRLLVDDLLEYSHVRNCPPEKEAVDLNKKLALVQGDLEVLIKEKAATINVGPLPIIQGYRRQLQQIFQNLLTNALKYSKEGVPPKIDISCTEIIGHETGLPLPSNRMKERFYKIDVKDNGIGFEQSDADRIFNVFTRLHGRSEYSGTGVGLSIVKKVVENHNGYIYAKSEPDKGACFTILLPVQ